MRWFVTPPDIGVNPIPPDPAPARPGDGNPLQTTKIDALGVKVELPLPKWVIACLGIVIVLASAAGGAYLAINKVSSSAIVPKDQLSVYQATQYHFLIDPEARQDIIIRDFPNDGTTLTIRHYQSDGCIQVIRLNHSSNKAESKWLFGSTEHTSDGTKHGELEKSPEVPEFKVGSEAVQMALNSLATKPPTSARIVLASGQYQGRCLDPHPGQFSVANQQINQCLVQVWRYFADGCVHYQFFNPCSGSWDVYPNGAPHVTWTRCIH
jgi:hypothetical protein